ncbi:MAG: energy transducer TonB, partial [Burkholderiaceae bacterium]
PPPPPQEPVVQSAGPSVPASALTTETAPPEPASAETTAPARSPAPLSATDRDLYRASLISHLTAAKRYPQRAQRRRIQGEVIVRFVINSQGRILDKQIEQSSGADILDQAALSMIDRASPLPAPPAGYGTGPYSFTIPVSFSLR